ncbi:MAG TPA: hypothetical protein VLZ83_03270 [Edaphocola sp.]|nr:hypothetical protein [Edaphocola sp.]
MYHLKTFKNTFNATVLVAGFLLIFSACNKDDPKPDFDDKNATVLDCDYFIKNTDATLKDNPDASVDYIVTCMMRVDGKLTIEPGVVIAFEQDAGLNFRDQSSFKMEGTAAKPIILTGKEQTKGYWSGIYTQSSNSANKMSYVTIDYAGGTGLPSHGQKAALGVYGSNSPITLENCTIKNSKNKGMLVSGSVGKNEKKVFMTNCVLTQNDMPIGSNASRLRMYNGTNSFKGNTNDYVYLDGGSIFGDATWAKLDVPYLMKNTANYGFQANDGVLTVEPGTDIMMSAQSKIRVFKDASLVMLGTAQDPITIRGEKDIPGFWNQITIYSSSPLNEIGHVNVKNGGQTTGLPNGAVCVDFSTYLNIHNVVFTKCFEYGVSLNYKVGMPLFHLEYDNLSLDNTPKLFSDYVGAEVIDPFNP